MIEKLCHESPDIIGKTFLAKAAIDWYIQGIAIVELLFRLFCSRFEVTDATKKEVGHDDRGPIYRPAAQIENTVWI